MLDCERSASKVPANSSWFEASTNDQSMHFHVPNYHLAFEVSDPPVSPRVTRLQGEMRKWTKVLKAVSLGLLLLGLAELLGLPLLQVHYGKWAMRGVVIIVSGLTLVAAGLGIQAIKRTSSVTAHCYLCYLIGFSVLLVIAEVVVSMLSIKSTLLSPSSAVLSREDGHTLSGEVWALQLMLGMLGLVLATACVCSILVYCALRYYQTAKAYELLRSLVPGSRLSQSSRESLD